MKTILHPTAGYIANCGQDDLTGYVADMDNLSAPGELDPGGRELLRSLSKQVAQIASLDEQVTKRDLWLNHCGLRNERPMLLVFPEDSWCEIMPANTMVLTDPYWSQLEWYLRHIIYRHEYIVDDFIVEPVVYVTKAIRTSGWGLEPIYTRKDEKGSYVWEACIQQESDLDKLKHPTCDYDESLTQIRLNMTRDVIGDILEIREHCLVPGMLAYDIASDLRGLEQLMMDMYDRPKWLHHLMDFISEGVYKQATWLEDKEYLTTNNFGHYVDTGGIAYSDEVGNIENGRAVKLEDLWGYGAAQAAVGVGPDLHEEFILQYDKKLLDRFGLVSYGCCEPYHAKFDMLKRNLGNLRRVSVSPWCNDEKAAEALGKEYIYSLKPNPALIADFDPDRVRADIRQRLEASKGCNVEIILKDTFTIQNDPKRVTTWTNIVREEIERIVG